jgi:hypothetical protein
MNERDQLLLEQWKMASQFHLQMDNMAWQRAGYFAAANGVLLGVLGSIASITEFTEFTGFIYRTPLLWRGMMAAIPLLGMLISWVWAVVQKRGQLYHCYRLAQARRTEETLTAGGERVLTLYEKGINKLDEQDLQNLADLYLTKFGVYLRESWLGKIRTHDLIFTVAVSLMTIWLLLVPAVSLYAFHSIWVCIAVSLIPAFLWLWLVWDACLLPCMKRPPDQSGS